MKARLFKHSASLGLSLLLFALVLACFHLTASAQTRSPRPAGAPPAPAFPLALSLDFDPLDRAPVFSRVSPAILDRRGLLVGRLDCPAPRLIFSTASGDGTTATYEARDPDAERAAAAPCLRAPAPSFSSRVFAFGGEVVKEITVAVP